MPNVEGSVTDLLSRLSGIVHVHDGKLEIADAARLRADGIRDLAWTAAFTDDPATAEVAQWIVWEAAQQLGARSASIHELYAARARGAEQGDTADWPCPRGKSTRTGDRG